jgi:menaquinone-dependent protoporphyrinogen oxidase
MPARLNVFSAVFSQALHRLFTTRVPLLRGLEGGETMSKILIAYGTSEGQTAKIAEQLAGFIRAQGHDAFTGDIARGAPGPAGYQAVIVGASVHKGKHQRWVVDYVRRNRPALEHLPSAFFSVSLAIQDGTEKGRLEAEGYVETFVKETGWYPEKVGLFAGALVYTKYNFLLRWVMRRIARSKGTRDLDTSRDYVYTDQDAVKRFAEEFLPSVAEARLASG